VFETVATIESELKKFEYLEPLLKNNKLIPNIIANTIAIFDLPKALNILFYGIACIILAAIRESKIMIDLNKFEKIIAGNWKLNGTFESASEYFNALQSKASIKSNVCAIICPPSILLSSFPKITRPYYLGAQDCSIFDSGAYTGEISAVLLKESNCKFCILGHSERRQLFNETNENIQLKVEKLINESINPIVCIGETMEEKNQGLTNETLSNQIIKSLPKNASDDSIIIAYEPIWAIGTGLMPTLQEIDEIHNFIKNGIKNFKNFKVLYGGSVKSNNSSDILNLPHVDGVLVGGSSLEPMEFIKILNS
jgi:triosephosphate isomerase